MKIYLAADHAGFELKNRLSERLTARGHEVLDLGANTLDPNDDYPVYAFTLAKHVAANPAARGILVCGSGQGMAIAANRVKGVRAAIAWNDATAKETREDNDSNVLSLPARFIDPPTAESVVDTWLETEFSGEDRHRRRNEQLEHGGG